MKRQIFGGMTLEEALKPDIWKCAKCGGPLYVHKYLWEKEIKGICWCPKCSPAKGEA